MSTFEEIYFKKGPPQPASAKDELSWLEGFSKSFAYSPVSLIGVDAPESIQQWQAINPGSAFAAEALGYLVPYTGWFKAAKNIPRLAKAVDAIGSAEKLAESPFRARLAMETVRFAPFEAGRVAAAATIGDEIANALETTYRGTSDVALQTGLDLALGGAVAGGFQVLASAGTKALKNFYTLPGVDLKAPKQIQLRQLQENLAKGIVSDKEGALAGFERLAYGIRSEKPVSGKYVIDLEDGATKAVNRLFKEKDGTELLRARIVQKIGGTFKTRNEIEGLFGRAGLETNPEAWMQHPRYIKAKTQSSSRLLRNILSRQLKPLDTNGGLFFSRDKVSGLYVMAKRIANDEWLLFKTDSPGRFAPEYEAFKNVAEKRAGIFNLDERKLKPLGEGAEVFDAGVKFNETVPLMDMRGLDPRKGGFAVMTEKLLAKAGVNKMAPRGSALAEGAAQFAKTYLAPGMFQFSHPVASRAFNMAKHLLDTAEGTAERLFLGTKGISEKKGSLLKEVVKGARPLANDDNLQALIGEVYKTQEQIQAVWKTVISQSSIEDGIKNYGLDGAGLRLLQALQKADGWVIPGLNKTLEVTGNKPINPLTNHFMLSRIWIGDWRIPIYQGNELIGVVAGKTKGAAQEKARNLLGQGGELFRAGEPALAGELEQDLRYLRRISPERAKLFGELQRKTYVDKSGPRRLVEERAGVKGYSGETKPWTKDEFEHLVLKQLRDYQRYQAKISTDHMLKNDLMRLSLENPKVHEQLVHRINSMYGQQGKFSQAIEDAADKLLSPVLGKNSASKIVGAANKWMFRWTLGFVNAGYNVANMLTFVQTAFPQIAFITSAAPSRVSQYYTHFPVFGQKVPSVGMLDMFKLAKRSFQVMRNPDQLLWKHFGRAASESVWDPKVVEEWVGQGAERTKALRDVLKGDEPFSNWFTSVADALPSMTEKFSRAHSFALGHTFFREILGIQDEEILYQLTKQFVEKTNFLYATGDRARIITGPLGSAIGVFKNWIMHYISWMAEFTGEGVARGNWKPLLWMMGGTTAVGGAAALPFYGVMDSMSKTLSDKSLMQNTYEMFGGGSASDAAFYGFPAFLGFSLQNQVSVPGADGMQDAARLFSLVYLDRAKYLGKVFDQGMSHFDATGENPIRDPRTRDLLMRALAPKTLYRVGQVWEDKTLKSLSTGYPVTDLTPVERVMSGLGVNPLWAEKAFRVSEELWQDQNKMREAVASYGQAWASAMEARDTNALRNIILRAIYEGVDVSSVIKSANARLEKGREDIISRQFSPHAVFQYRQAGLVRAPVGGD